MFQPLIDILSALLTPVVAVAALYLGYRQYKIERFMAKQALYSRRLAIYMTTTSYARGLAYDSRHNLDAELAMRAAASEASFLLPRQVASAVKEVLDRGVNIRVNQSLIPDSPPDDERGLTQSIRDDQIWLMQAEASIHSIFEPYLSLTRGDTLR